MKAIEKFHELLHSYQEKNEPFRVKIQTVGGKDARYEVADVEEDHFIDKNGVVILFSAIASFSDVSSEPLRA